MTIYRFTKEMAHLERSFTIRTGTILERLSLITGVITVVVDGDGSYNCQDTLGGPYTPLEIAVSCAPPSCADPTALTIANLTTTSADLGWTAGGTETMWNIEYGPAGFTPGTGTIVATGTNPYTLGGLTSNTAYDFYVQADCGADSSVYVGPESFSTPCGQFRYSRLRRVLRIRHLQETVGPIFKSQVRGLDVRHGLQWGRNIDGV